MRFNKEQLEAINFNDAPLVIKAGAGTGKTAVITKKIANLILQEKALPQEILALTFTDKAAGEMQDRVELELPPLFSYSDFWILTFHAFCERILRNNALDIGLPTNFKVIDDIGARILSSKEFKQFKLDYYKPEGNPARLLSDLLSHFSRCKDEMISPESYLKLAQEEKEEEVAKAYQTYQEILLNKGCLDFGDLLLYTLKLFQKRPLILEKYRKLFKYLVVDEFQDTNRVQYEILNLLAKGKKKVTICLDGNQSIYEWRGASSDNLKLFKKDYPGYKEIFLSKNYRSYQNILDLTHRFLPKGDKLKSMRKGKGDIEHLHFISLEKEQSGIADKIIELSKEMNFGEIAVLTRTNRDAEKITLACERKGIPCRFFSMKGLYKKEVILNLLSYFRLLDNYHENSAVYRMMDFFLIRADETAKVTEYAHKKSQSIYSVLLKIRSVPGLSNQTVSKVEKMIKMIKKDSDLSLPVSEIYISFLQNSGYLNRLKGDFEGLSLIDQFFNRIKRFEETNPFGKLRDFMQEIDLELDSGETGSIIPEFEDDDIVKIMTVHSAKGLEFKYVIIANMVDRRFPADAKSEPIGASFTKRRDHLWEERRLFYVAMTRAKEGITFTSASDYGGSRKKKLSQFMTELGFFEKDPIVKKDDYKKKKVLKKRDRREVREISFTKIAAYSNCPRQYYYTHILKIPTRDKPAQVFGQSIHTTLYRILKEKPTSLKEALAIYDSCWIGDWYNSETKLKENYEAGKKIVKRVFGEFKKNPPKLLMINNNPALEQTFKVNLGGYTLKGKIDRIDLIDDGVEIIDYKTGKLKKKLTVQEKDQLVIYQMAIEEIFGLKVKKLTFNFLASGEKISFDPVKIKKEETLERVIEKAKLIGQGNFEPNPGWHCRYCDFNKICEDSVT